MSLNRKQPKKSALAKTSAIISAHVGNYANHPHFVKKAEKAKAFIDANGLPKELEQNQK